MRISLIGEWVSQNSRYPELDNDQSENYWMHSFCCLARNFWCFNFLCRVKRTSGNILNKSSWGTFVMEINQPINNYQTFEFTQKALTEHSTRSAPTQSYISYTIFMVELFLYFVRYVHGYMKSFLAKTSYSHGHSIRNIRAVLPWI